MLGDGICNCSWVGPARLDGGTRNVVSVRRMHLLLHYGEYMLPSGCFCTDSPDWVIVLGWAEAD
jgi:hypothetical protein